MTYAQVSFYRETSTFKRNLKENELQNVRTLTTLFVLPECYSRATYDSILKKSWKVTPYKIVTASELDYEMLISGQYTLAMLTGNIYFLSESLRIQIEFNFLMLEGNLEKIKKGYAAEKDASGKRVFALNNMVSYARIRLQMKPEKTAEYTQTYCPTGCNKKTWEKEAEILALVVREKAMNNFTEGHLLNYFKQISDLIATSTSYHEINQRLTPDGKKTLKANILYLPDYVRKKGNWKNSNFELLNDAQMKQIFAHYKGKYEIITEEEIGKKIVNGDDFYYMRFCYSNTGTGTRYFDIVNSVTCIPIFRHEVKGDLNLIPVDFELMWE